MRKHSSKPDELSRRDFIAMAGAMGASVVLGLGASPGGGEWRERRDLYPEGVASGDPTPGSVLLWTRRPFDDRREAAKLTVEVAEDQAFRRVIASASVNVSLESDWTCRALVGGLKSSRVYWYRFTDESGLGSRVGRTITAPDEHDSRPAKFAFVSCQNANQGAMNAYRRM